MRRFVKYVHEVKKLKDMVFYDVQSLETNPAYMIPRQRLIEPAMSGTFPSTKTMNVLWE